MSISDTTTKRHPLRSRLKPAAVCTALAALCVVIDFAYAAIGRRGNSPWMEWMFLIPLLGGAALWLAVALAAPRARWRRGFRPAFNLWNAGLAALTAGCLLKGIFDIAGTDSVFVPCFWAEGLLLLVASGVVFAARK